MGADAERVYSRRRVARAGSLKSAGRGTRERRGCGVDEEEGEGEGVGAREQRDGGGAEAGARAHQPAARLPPRRPLAVRRGRAPRPLAGPRLARRAQVLLHAAGGQSSEHHSEPAVCKSKSSVASRQVP